ncbi:hypothetical protein DEM91_00880 [Prevotella sp. TCVGH]|nr:hypothetical protein [Prevotella sp. TCVGH]
MAFVSNKELAVSRVPIFAIFSVINRFRSKYANYMMFISNKNDGIKFRFVLNQQNKYFNKLFVSVFMVNFVI